MGILSLRTASDLLSRLGLGAAAGITFEGKRDMGAVLGYKPTLTPADYRLRFKRGGLAARVVDAYPRATWRGGAELIEDEDPKVVTPFEEEWDKLARRLNVWSIFARADILAGLGRYAGILIGAPGDLATELPMMSGPDDIAFLAPYGEDLLKVDRFEEDSASPRFGMPMTYHLTVPSTATRTLSRVVHWSRVIHVADGLLDDQVNGTPRMERVWNYLDDLDKVTGGGSEAFWLRVHQGYHFQLDPTAKIDAAEVKDLKEKSEEFAHGLRRTLATRGMDLDVLGSDVSNFSNQLNAIVSLISGATGIPQRILLGSERGELASTQDKENWDTRVGERRDDFGASMVVRPFAQRLIDHGALPEPEEYEVRWPELDDLTDIERAEVATAWAGLNAKAGGTVVMPSEIRDRVLRLDELSPEQIAEMEPDPVPPPLDPDGGEPPPAADDEAPAGEQRAAAGKA